MKLSHLVLFFALSIALSSPRLFAQVEIPQKFLVKVYLEGEKEISHFKSLSFDLATQKINNYAEVVAGPEELISLAEMGYRTEIVPGFNSNPEVIEYPSYEEVYVQLRALANQHPDIMRLSVLGYSQRLHLPIPLIKISDNPGQVEDESSILYDGMHHAREPVGMLCSMVILEYLLNNYGSNYQVTEWVDNTEIFIVPILNVEGWQYLYNNNLGNPWWRKNMRENNGNTVFQPSVDGVDLNRNYNFNFNLGGSENIGSWTYRGTTGFSESETRAKRDLTLAQKFVASITYHSYGEIILYPWNESPRPGDAELLQKIAQNMAYSIPALDGMNSYQPVRSGCQVGQSPCWMVGVGGVLEVLVETGDVFIPDRNTGDQIAWDNLDAALYLMGRVQGPGLKGLITDAHTGEALEAVVNIIEIDNGASAPRTSDPTSGRYYRLLERGTYTVEVIMPGYKTKTVPNVEIVPGMLQELDIKLDPQSSYSELFDQTNPNLPKLISYYPNPFHDFTRITVNIPQSGHYRLSVYNTLGQNVGSLIDDSLHEGSIDIVWDGQNESGELLASGLYFITLSGPHGVYADKILKK